MSNETPKEMAQRLFKRQSKQWFVDHCDDAKRLIADLERKLALARVYFEDGKDMWLCDLATEEAASALNEISLDAWTDTIQNGNNRHKSQEQASTEKGESDE